ncbi:MAG: Glycosyl transferase family 4 [Candidatus Falkowbacteria bacterium GW2011_GWF2_39_8]|uniref:Glycosyl transferase family 4 n=1 Tax=Candidatus Falkowbacteria bacterium GW2011_GWF2_39_8 TaxID=1618642 RepID=A0A0G0SFT5_9BACT|nr:MAG: Glycosyl transferase family 4 [Candidatus Falkowbacteria bacterium GW2011_GWF2_39_8]
MFNFYLTISVLAIAISAIFTFFVIKLAKRIGAVDVPEGERKIHKTPTPLMGGLAIFLTFFLVLFFVQDKLLVGNLQTHHFIGFFIGGLFLMLGGFLDDKYNLSPKYQFIFPILAIISVIAGGVEIEKITNPFGFIQGGPFVGGYIYLGYFSSILIGLWLLGMMYTTKLLDGMDGLVTGITAVGGLVIFLFTLTTKYYQPDISLAALVLSAACLGFLIFNWHPAKIFLGEGGSLFLGYALGVLAIISGGKFAIALLIMGVPILDVVWTIARRLAAGKNPFKIADRKHLHHRILDLGIGQRKTVLIFYLFSLIFGLSAIFLQSLGKIFALMTLLVIMILIIFGFEYLDKRNDV